MVYQNKFVAEIKSNGKILRMKDGYISLPFGSEYTILLKNLNSQRASVDISIDGENVLDNSSLIVGANETSEIKGFLKGNVARNSFKFIQKTEEIMNHRGDRIDDGMIRIEYAFEKTNPVNLLLEKTEKENPDVHVYHHWNYGNWFSGDSGMRYNYNSSMDLASSSKGERGILSRDSVTCENVGQTPQADEGITVKGSQINQHFNYASIGELEDSQVIVIRLRGSTPSGHKVQSAISVKDKLTCSSCGRKSNSSFKFCPNCGTFLE